jgi:hypothetical protein
MGTGLTSGLLALGSPQRLVDDDEVSLLQS